MATQTTSTHAAECSVPLLDLTAQYATIRDEVQEAVNKVLEKQHFILGPEVAALEQEVAAYCGRRYAVGVASGTDALILSLRAAGIGPGDEVILPSFTFIATADAVSLLGGTPVFADIQPDTFNLDPVSVEKRVCGRTKAVIPVHLYGQSAEMDGILQIAKAHNLTVIEDTAQAIGATYKGAKVASMGDFGCISFFPSKNLGGYGDGGMIVTDSEEACVLLKSLRAHGATKKYYSERQGWNSRLDELQAAILRVKLRHLDHWNEARRGWARQYTMRLDEVIGVRPPFIAGWGDHVFHQYTVCVSNRDKVRNELQSRGVSSTVYYPVPIHLQPIYRELGYKIGDLPETEAAARGVLSLPIYPELTLAQVEHVVTALRDAVSA
jgi:dTDP-4-amino-4,6-dideoxygalactose transaminase